MRRYKYTGIFIGDNDHRYEIEVHCNGYIQALILLTADAIRSGKHYQLTRIENEKGDSKNVADITLIGKLIS